MHFPLSYRRRNIMVKVDWSLERAHTESKRKMSNLYTWTEAAPRLTGVEGAGGDGRRGYGNDHAETRTLRSQCTRYLTFTNAFKSSSSGKGQNSSSDCKVVLIRLMKQSSHSRWKQLKVVYTVKNIKTNCLWNDKDSCHITLHGSSELI